MTKCRASHSSTCMLKIGYAKECAVPPLPTLPGPAQGSVLRGWEGTAVKYYSSSTQRWPLNKCASEERNIEEVRHKIKVSNHSATRLVRFWQKPNQGHCIQTVAIETTHSCQTGTFKPAGRVITLLWHARLSPRNYPNCQAPHFNWQHRKVTVRDHLWLEEL